MDPAESSGPRQPGTAQVRRVSQGFQRAHLVAALLAASFPWGVRGEGEAPLRGKVVLSDGRVIEGVIRGTPNRDLDLYDLEGKRERSISLAEVLRIEIHVEKAEMLRPWRFKEEGSPEKVFWGKPYPRHDYWAAIDLVNGRRLRGRLTGVVYVGPGGDAPEERFIVRQFRKGGQGQTFDDLVYVSEVEIAGAPKGGGEILLRADPAGGFVAARALSLRRGTVLNGRLQGDTFRIEGLAPGAYHLLLESPERYVVGWRKTRLDGKVRSEIEGMVSGAMDFFDERRIVGVFSPEDGMVHLLLDLWRHARSTSFETHDRTFRQIVVWSLRRTENRWVIEDRTILFREAVGDRSALRKIELEEGLAGREPGEKMGAVVDDRPPSGR